MKIIKGELRERLHEAFLRHHVPGVSVGILHEGVLTSACAGVINVNTGVEVTPQTVMHIGSIAKVFTTTLVMQLLDEGRVDLDEKVVRYLPDLQLKDCAALKQITVKMLLNHTSGIDGELLPDYGHDEETIEKAIRRFAELGQLHGPGLEFSYCNAGFVIAGYLAQRLTGTSWYRLIRERLFLPLGMEHAVALPEEALLHSAGVGHYWNGASDKGVARTSSAFLPLSFGPAGTSLMMSAEDLIAFANAHMCDGVGVHGARIVSAQSARAMQQVTFRNRGKGYTYSEGVGIGWMVSESGLLHHVGGGPGIVSALYVYPKERFAAAILTNAQHSISLIHEFLQPWLEEVGIARPFEFAEPGCSAKHETIDPHRYSGVYENVLNRYQISESKNRLTLSKQEKFTCYEDIVSSEGQPVRLIPLGRDKFALESEAGNPGGFFDAFIRVVTFRNPNAEGRMQHLGNSLRLYKRVP